MEVNEQRLKETLDTINSIGRDASLGEGLHRKALSAYDFQGREYIKNLMLKAGLEVITDGALNIHGRLNWPSGMLKPSPACRVIAIGSHCDTVPGGGDLDGTLGVLAGIEALTRMKELGVDIKYPIEVIDFTDEEGRFGGMLGSMSLAGKLVKEQIEALSDADGVKVIDKLHENQTDASSAAAAAYPPDSLHAYVELHIEQGPVLDTNKEHLGVVTGIVGLWKAEFTFSGQANHAGTTPMSMRSDAFAGCADLRMELDALLSRYGSCDSVGTIGKVEVSPGAANIVPALCVFTLEVRDPSSDILKSLEANIRRTAGSIAARRKLSLNVRVMSDMACMKCDEGLMQCIEQAIADSNFDSGVVHRRMPSGAAHDAQHMPRLGPTAMIFVPSIDGISHHCTERTDWKDIVRGANVLLRTLFLLGSGQMMPLAVEPARSVKDEVTDEEEKNLNTSKESSICLKNVALLSIDMQSMPPTSVRSDVDFNSEQISIFHGILESKVLPNAASILRFFRRQGLEVIHTRIQSLTQDGRDRSALHKRMGVHAAPDDPQSFFLRGVEPLRDEIVLTKTASNAFVSTNIHFVLTNIGIKRLVVMGTLTDECVASTAKAAADMGYEVIVISDACAAGTVARHQGAMETLSRYAVVMDTESYLTAAAQAASKQ